MASVECLGQAWPENPETQNEVIEELLNVLDAMIKNTTRKLQVSELLELANWLATLAFARPLGVQKKRL